MKERMLALIILGVTGTLGGGIMTLAIGLPGSPCAGMGGSTQRFTIIANFNGYNESRGHQGPRPLMIVHKCDKVVINVVNTDTQTHGFAVDYYAVKGMEIQGQQSQSVEFLASRTGQFRVYCIVFCTSHAYMQNGLLNVN